VSSSAATERGFSLLEIMVALVVVALLASALALPVAAQLRMRRADEARRGLDEARDAVLAFAAVHGRLPCPATLATRGQEAFAHDGDPANGRCADFHGGLLPAAALGMAPLDDAGFFRDPWQSPGNRVRYAVHGGTINAVAHALTRANGMRQATLPALGDTPHYLFVCSAGDAAGPTGCGPPVNQLTRRAAFVILATGANGAAAPAPGSDEARNLDADASFVSRDADAAGFDDIVHWASIHIVIQRLLAAGRLP
jgi:prepilin-type N-terminal cleavage/methylation domain-containing protein